jgi:hypothetical protein
MGDNRHLETNFYKKLTNYPPVFSSKIIGNFNDTGLSEKLNFVTKKEIIPSASIDINTIVGTDNDEIAGLTWQEFLHSGAKMPDAILQAESNPSYYHNNNIKEGIAYTCVDEETFVSGDGNHRSCIAKYLLINSDDHQIHGVRITKLSVANDIFENFKNIQYLFRKSPVFKHIRFNFKESIQKQSNALTYEYELKFSLLNTRSNKDYTILVEEFPKIEKAISSYKWSSKFYTKNSYLEAILE